MILYETLEITDAETYANVHGEESRTSCTSIPTPSAVHVVQNISQLLYLLIVTSPEMPHQHAGRQVFFVFFYFALLHNNFGYSTKKMCSITGREYYYKLSPHSGSCFRINPESQKSLDKHGFTVVDAATVHILARFGQ